MTTKTRYITISPEASGFSVFFRKFKGEKKDYDFSSLASLRQLLSNEKARILHVIKIKKPSSIYELAKILARDFKSVRQDVLLLERFGFLDLMAERTGKRVKFKPVIAIDSINLVFNI